MEAQAQLQAFIRGASKLPVLPEVTIRLLNTVDYPESSSNDLAEIIEADASLSARFLKLANSSFYGQRGHISTVRNAVVVLGFKTIRSLALTVWTQTLRSQALDPEVMRLMAPLFTHGLHAGVAAALLVERMDRSLSEDAFMGGLLHDIGRVALLSQLGKDYQTRILEPAERDGHLVHEREQEVLGFDHRHLGSALMTTWGLPPFLADVAEKHHDPAIVPRDQIFVAAVALADAVATRFGCNVALGTPRPQREELATYFGLQDEESTAGFHEQCLERVRILGEALE
jgi:HD-like signal output (HDOD) protein